jgi:sugar phosphate isomerase/epimerase
MLGAPARPVEQVVDAAAAGGFEAIGLDRPMITDYEARVGGVPRLAAHVRAAGLTCTDVLPFFAESGDIFSATAAARDLAELADVLGAQVIVASVPAPLPWDEIVERFGAATAELRHTGVRLAVEYIPHSGLPTLAHATRLCAELAWNGIAIVLDSYHSFLGGATLAEIRALTATQIALVQFSDARALAPVDRPDESRNHRQVPGEGVLPLASWVDAVRSTGYDGVVAAEVLSQRMRESDDLFGDVSRCYASLVDFWPSR